MTHRFVCSFIWAVALISSAVAQTSVSPYFPDRFEWQRRTPQQAGLDAAALDEAIKFALANENPAPKDQALAQAQSFGASEPFSSLIGPTKVRAALNGLVVYRGYVVAEWGDTRSVDMTHSVTKTFLTTVVGLAWQKGLIRDVGRHVVADPVADVGLFDAPHNQRITWEHLLRQTSDWQGTLWSKPDWADRPEGQPGDWANRKLYEPGTRYKYNDVRVNVLALATLYVIRRPLPDVLREEVMDPIGASSAWRWHGYENSWVTLDGERMQSVSGGGHWGGGMFISALDQARFGLLTLRRGKWRDRQIVSEKWVSLALTPTPVQPGYGFMNWFLNTERRMLPSAPANSFCHRGAGVNVVCVVPDQELVIVARWIRNEAVDGLVQRVLASITERR